MKPVAKGTMDRYEVEFDIQRNFEELERMNLDSSNRFKKGLIPPAFVEKKHG